MAAVGESGAPAAPGVVDLYRAMLAGARATFDAVRRRRIAIAIEVSLIAAYVLLRTFDAGRPALTLWVLVAIVIAIASPVSGLVVLAAIAPFSEPFSITRQLGAKPVLVVAVATGALVRFAIWGAAALLARRSRNDEASGRPAVAYGRPRLLAAASLASALVLLVGTGLGVAHTALTFDQDFADAAAQTWLAGIGGGMLVLLAAAWAGYRGTIRPLVAAVASATVGGIVSLVDFLDGGAIRGAVVDWLLRPNRFESRLTGIIPSPNAVEALLIVPTAVLVSVAVLGRDVRLRVTCSLAALPLAVALYYTYSRAALIGIFLIAVTIVWRIRRRVGMALLAGGIIVGLLALPTYLRLRNEAVGPDSQVTPGDLLVASDAYRLRAWGAAGAMWLGDPLIGHGFMSYQALHALYGDPVLRSPHNEWLRLFAEEGLVVGIAGFAFVAFTAVALGGGHGAMAIGVLSGFLGLVVAATFNNPFLFVQVLAIACTIVGIGIGRTLAADEPIIDAALDGRGSADDGPRGHETEDPDNLRYQERFLRVTSSVA